MSSEKMTSKTSGQVGRKFAYDYYHTDSDNDGLADVHDAEDLNPDIQSIGQQKDTLKVPESKKQHKDNPRRITKGKNNKGSTGKEKNPRKKTEEKNQSVGKTKKKSKLNFEEKKGTGKLTSDSGGTVITMAAAGREVLRRKYQYERIEDSDQNAALQAADAGREASVSALKGTSRKFHHGLSSRNQKVTARRSDGSSAARSRSLNFERAANNSRSRQKTVTMSKQYQKKKLKRSYGMNVRSKYANKAKTVVKGIAGKVKQAIGAIAKKVGAYIIGIILAMIMLVNTVGAFTGMISNGVSVILSTSYQSSDQEITATENVYNRLEADLKHAIDNVESDYSGYDEYRYYIGTIGHDPYELMAYLTAKYGEFTSSQVNGELSRIFDEQYDYSLRSTTQTRTRTVTRYYRDSDTGEWTTETYEDTYDWDILTVSLTTSDLSTILVSRLSSDEKEQYDVFMETKGNFPSLPSPLRQDWKNAVTSMYGYRLDPFDGHVEFHTGIDIARPVGTELVAVIDGTVSDVGYSSGYGNYLELTNENGQSVFYAHCDRIDVSIGANVVLGQKVAEMGSSGNSTGSHLHFEVKDADGVRLNPYFYLSDEIADDPL